MSSLEFMNICRDFRVGDMLHLGAIKSRMLDGSGISCSEFLYQILQAYDWYRLSQDYNCYMQVSEKLLCFVFLLFHLAVYRCML